MKKRFLVLALVMCMLLSVLPMNVSASTTYVVGNSVTVCGNSYTDDFVDALGHTETTIAGKEATCTETGLTEGKKCTECGTITVNQETIAAKGHHFVDGICDACGAVDETKITLWGDADGNGKVQTNDAKLILQYCAEMIGEEELDLTVIDVDGNGKIQTNDAKLILQYCAEMIDKFPVEDPVAENTSLTITDAQNAITQLGENAEEFGYENAFSELTEKSTSTIDGDSYYRLQQNYRGIPVYGRTVVCATDENGNVTSLTGNLVDVNEKINLTPTITIEQVSESVKAYLSNVQGIENANNIVIENLSENNLCIYIDPNGTYSLAYCIQAENYELVVSATSSSVLSSKSLTTNYSNAEILDELEIAYSTMSDGSIFVQDTVRNISVYKLENAEDLSRETEDLLSDESKFYIINPESDIANGVYAMTSTVRTYDYFSQELGRTGYNNNNGPCYVLMCSSEVLCDQAKATADDQASYLFVGVPSNLFTSPIGKALDVIAHEYTHLITQAEIGLIDGTEQAAISEALSDILGNAIEAFYRDGIDIEWKLGEDAGYCKYSMANTVTMEQFNPNDDSGHSNAQIIAHAAYLMWNGIDGSDSKKISTDDLAKLWYRAMLMMPSDCNFNDCRQLVELAATSMELTTAQIECVSEAFDAVGITGTTKESFNALYDLTLDSTLSVYGGDGKLYDNYTLNITGNTTVNGPVIEKVDSSYNRTRTITTAKPYQLNLPQGIYVFTITDNMNPSATSTFTVCVQNNDGDANIDIFTNFGCTLVTGTVSEIKEINGVETNVPITNATVKVYSHAQEIVVETIDMSETEGIFKVPLPIGNYSIAVEADGYASSTTSFELTSDKAVYLEITLEPNTQKQLTSIATYQNGEKSEEYQFSYNDLGQVIGLVAYRYEDGKAIKWYNQKYEYDANGNLILTEHGSSQSYHYQYDYDSNGRITGYSSIEYYEDIPGPSDNYVFSYDNQGRIIEKRNEDSSYVEEFSYDDSENTIYESAEFYWGDGHFIETTVYDYTYAPLVISTYTSESEEYGNSSSKSISFMPHWNLAIASCDIDDSCFFDVDSSGYLLRVTDSNGKNVYVCTYEEALTEQSDVAQWYKQVLQTHPEATKHSFTSSGEVREYQYDTEYTLYDIDKNGIPELIVQEDLSNYYVYTMSDSGATLCGKFYWSYDDCLYAYDGNGLIVHDGGMGTLRLEYLWLYTLTNDVLDSTDTIISTEESSEDELYNCLKKYTRISNFVPITDYSLLENQ